MNNQSNVIQSNNAVHCFGGKEKEFRRLISDFKAEIEKLKMIRSRYF